MKRKEKTATKGWPSGIGWRGVVALRGRYKAGRLSMVGSAGQRRRAELSFLIRPAEGGGGRRPVVTGGGYGGEGKRREMEMWIGSA